MNGSDALAEAAGLPSVAGAYALLIRLDGDAHIRAGALGVHGFAAGLYVYAGSARGPGGIRARVSRHLRSEKRAHWHVDHLLARGRILDVAAVEGGNECALIDAFAALPGASVPVAGFGATDCRRCAAHLAAVPDGTILAAVIPPRGRRSRIRPPS
jgi:Uri superfamily endonuclease